MALTVNGTAMEKCNVNGSKCKQVNLNGTKIWCANKELLNSSVNILGTPTNINIAGTDLDTLTISKNNDYYRVITTQGDMWGNYLTRFPNAVDVTGYKKLKIKYKITIARNTGDVLFRMLLNDWWDSYYRSQTCLVNTSGEFTFDVSDFNNSYFGFRYGLSANESIAVDVQLELSET